MLTPPGPHEVAYFSMEVALEDSIPTYAGGLGVLAGDTLRAAADLGMPLIGVTLLYRKGYFRQHLDESGRQTESPAGWNPEEKLELMKPVVTVQLEERDVKVRAWRYTLEGIGGDVVSVYLLDTLVDGNTPEDRQLTDYLYGGDDRYRLCQEIVLGMGGVALLPRLGHSHIRSYHMNEGHSALLTLALLKQHLNGRHLEESTIEDVHAVRDKCVFTTHTPVPAGHDQFSPDLVRRVLGPEFCAGLARTHACPDGQLNMTQLALYGSRYINGVAMQHGEVSRGMFPTYPVRAITNGVHAVRWTSPAFAALFDRQIPEWRRDNLYLRYAIGIGLEEILSAHREAKQALFAEVERRTGKKLDTSVLTIGFARRAATYKRADLVFTDLERLKAIDRNVGQIQLIFGGKAHPKDEGGKNVIQHVYAAARALDGVVPVIYLEDFDCALARLVCSGSDLWLNTPERPHEASGTSGMKAALNGVPSLSVLDGWWVEGCLEGATGWSIGESDEPPDTASSEAASLYAKLEHVIVPMYYGRINAYAKVMRNAIAINGSFFNVQRMVSQYYANAYFPAES